MTREYVPQWGDIAGRAAIIFSLISCGAEYPCCCACTRERLSVLFCCSGVGARQRHCLQQGLVVGQVAQGWASIIYRCTRSRPTTTKYHPSPHRMIRLRIRVSRRLARQYHHQAPSQRFNILYFGRDEFSCQVLEILYSATGMVPLTLGSLIKTRIDTSSPTDVWQNLLIATQPDQMIGRKRDILSIRQSPLPTLSASFSHSSASLAPLKTLSDKLKLPVTTIPQIRSELKTWTVHPLPFFPSSSPFKKIKLLSPPSPRHPSIPCPAACRLHPITSCSLHHSDASFPSAFSHFLDRRTPSMYTHPLYQPTAALRPSNGPS